VISTTSDLGANYSLGIIFLIASIYILLLVLPATAILEHYNNKGKLWWNKTVIEDENQNEHQIENAE
jgi:hypothetical protein